jgi:glycosyltransferase involved in cell wall biosynthesis
MFRNEVNQGAQYSRNRGVAEARGELIAFVDDDDEWLTTKLERQAAFLSNASENTGLLYTWADTVTEDGFILHNYRETQRGKPLYALLNACFIPSPTVVVRHSVLEQVGCFDEALHSCQDWDMWTRITNAGYDVDVVPEVLALHHKHRGASIGTSPRSLQGFFQYYSKHALLYKRMGMTRNLSEKYRGLAQQARRVDDRELAKAALRCSVNFWKGNWKAWVQFAQAYAGMQ